MLPAVYEAPGPDFLHDLDSYGSYYSQESISRSHMFPIDTLGQSLFWDQILTEMLEGLLEKHIEINASQLNLHRVGVLPKGRLG